MSDPRSRKSDKRRKGDDRPHEDDPGLKLTFFPAPDEPFRWLPRHGSPLCVGEWFTQHIVKTIAFWPVYTAIVATLCLLLLIFGVPFVEDR